MVKMASKSTLHTEEKILSTVEKLPVSLRASLQEKLRSHYNSGCDEAESWVKTLKGVSHELSSDRSRKRSEIKSLGTLSNYCDRWLSAARA